MITIHLVRHGETIWNKSGKYQGSTDIPLSNKGIEQAEKLAEYMKHTPITAVYSSNLIRAKVTAEMIAKPHHLSVKSYAQLQELCFGDWEGLTFDEIESRWPGAIEKMYTTPSELEIENGETFQQMQERAFSCLQSILKQHKDGDTIVLVCHGGTNRVLLCSLLQLPIDFSWTIRQANTAVSTVWYNGDRNYLALLNSTIHLTGGYE